ncbi:MAG: LysE family translocator, partial [Sulfolobales archaeon]
MSIFSEIVKSFIYGFFYGLSLAVPPGPMNALIAARSIRSFSLGFSTGAGALTADLLFMILTYKTYELVRSLPIEIFYISGGLYMLILAITILRSSEESQRGNSNPDNSSRILMAYVTSLVLGVTNPYQILWWLTAGLSFISIFGFSAVLGLFIAILLWIILFPLAVRKGYYKSSRATILIVKIFSFTTLLVFSAIILYNGII